jgi:metal-dependent amidase/aminoacylase/carboxypeptidase family protein
MPEFGVSPMPAMAALMPALTALGGGGPLDEGFAMLTVTHASLGEPAFGVAPGRGEIWTTLRTLTDSRMADLRERAETLVRRIAAENGLGLDITYHDVFPHCESAPEPVAYVRRALEAEEIPFDRGLLPMRASEDFGHFGAHAPLGFYLLGAGERHASLHNPDYDFPDDLIAIGARVFMRILRNSLG